MSIAAVAAQAVTSGAVRDYEPPGLEDFWQPIIGDGAWAITRSCFLMVASAIIILWFLLATTKKMALVPGRGQIISEGAYGMVRNSIGRDLIGSKDFLRFTPLLFALFMTILVNNFFGVIPPFSFPTMSRIAFPIALTLVVWITFHVVGMKKHGFIGYWKSLVPSGLPGWIVPVIFVLELITDLFTRPVTLALRLFGNMFAGHLLLSLFITGGWYLLTDGGFLLPLAGGITWIFGFVMFLFEMLVEFLQAYVFTLLTALYIGGAVADSH